MILRRGLALLPTFGLAQPPEVVIRLHALDGIRGWASLIVVCFHMTWELFGAIIPEYRNPYTAALLDGQLAVSVFFVLSGEALSVGPLSGKGRRAVVSLALKRYPRLFIPILATSIVIFVVYQAGWVFNEKAGALVDRTDWLGQFMQGDITIKRVLTFSSWGVFTNKNSLDNLDPFLWTMRLELIGSVVVFITLYVLYGTRFAMPIIMVMTMVLLALRGNYGHIACFTAGILLAQFRLSGVISTLSKSHYAPAILTALLVFIYISDGYFHSRDIYRNICDIYAILIVLCLSAIPTIRRFMENPLSQFLGRASFPLFLMQFPIIITFTSICIIYAEIYGSLRAMAPAIALSSIALSLVTGLAFEPVEVLTKRVCSRFSKSILRGGV